ncbi:hypothetical protein [Methylocystis echinoides]|uniref:Uncharacterized protein n=1 Tax=Methylocystis echinoides TaxID=29468 RepID=A0A9W6GVJ2_9HYPH|nr:hypothetical protein [Methylocystis echinoides]GLI93670.1 hypothetical protein LMG27198_26620 [Methylocystis echinoides]
MSAPRIEQSLDGKWQVISGDGEIVDADLSNREAWRLIDRLSNEPNTRQEDVAYWVLRMEASP